LFWNKNVFKNICFKTSSRNPSAMWMMAVSVYLSSMCSVFTHTALAGAGISCRHVSVQLSKCSTETAKHRIMQTVPRDSPGTLVMWFQKSWQNSNGVTPIGGAKCRCGRLNAGAVAEKRRLSTWSISTVNLVRSQVYHTERPPYLFAARSPWCSAGLTATAAPCSFNRFYVLALL